MDTRDAGQFGLLVGVCAIFMDAAIAHGLFWDNDPYWTYWITKTFLIATVFTLGTAWLGAGLGRGAIIAAVHTLILEIYYQWFAPVGLPQEPEWLDFNHLWATGVPVHFLAIYAGYAMALWLWRRSRAFASAPASTALPALGLAVLALALSGAITHGLLLRSFPGITYFIQHLLVGFVFVYLWLTHVRLIGAGTWVGALMLALAWTTYSLYVGPMGLPAQPPYYLGYDDLWLRAFPGDLLAAVIAFAIFGMLGNRRRLRTVRATTTGLLLVPALLLPLDARAGELVATATAQGEGMLVVGENPVDMHSSIPLKGSLSLRAVEGGNRWSPVQNRDKVESIAEFAAGGARYRVEVDRAMPRHPLARYTTWNGVVFSHLMHGDTGIGTSKLPLMRPAISIYGWAKVYRDGQLIAPMAFTHIMVNTEEPMKGVMLEVETEDKGLVGAPDGYLTAMWPEVASISLPRQAQRTREIIGWIVLLGLTALFMWLARRESVRTVADEA